MRQYKTKGIIIKRQNYLETDKLLTIYTKDFGKITAIAKGVRKPLSKLSCHLQLFYEANLLLNKGKNIDLVVSAESINQFEYISKDSQIINACFFISELLYKSTQERLESTKIYTCFLDILKNITNNNAKKISYYFEQKLYQFLGIYPEIEKCVICQEKIKKQNYYLNIYEGGLVCSKCFKGLKNNISISENTIKLLKLIREKEIKYLLKIIVEKKILNEVIVINKAIRENNIDFEIKSEKYL